MLKRKQKQSKKNAEAVPKIAVSHENKFKRFAKKIAIEVGAYVLVVCAISAVMVLVTNIATDAQREERSLRKEVQSVRNKTQKLNAEVTNLGAASQLYVDLSNARPNMDFVINREMIRPLMLRLKDKYNLTTLNIQFTPQQQLEFKELEFVKGTPVRIGLNINLGGLSDHYLYAFIDELLVSLPGFIKLEKVRLQRQRAISIDVLGKISRGEMVETVTGTINFSWFGFEQSLQDEEAAGAANTTEPVANPAGVPGT